MGGLKLQWREEAVAAAPEENGSTQEAGAADHPTSLGARKWQTNAADGVGWGVGVARHDGEWSPPPPLHRLKTD